ncbi:MAG: response regulator [Deltaproteobacteria bacterium]|jgi:DNA-binding NtrC family response regulator|nr:response regulator [Deltaproteobacteria bacterium]MBW2535032.1 response regulator [Deltaproteobacteria bacterium]
MKKIRLLFVDDEEKFLRAMAKRLEMRGLEVHAFTNGTDAVAAADETPFDVALVDLKMPGMDGEELLGRLKKKHPLVEVVILTGHGSVASAVRATQAGAYEYLQKPCELDDVLEVLTKAYAKHVAAKDTVQQSDVEALMQKATGMGPMAILEELRKLAHRG